MLSNCLLYSWILEVPPQEAELNLKCRTAETTLSYFFGLLRGRWRGRQTDLLKIRQCLALFSRKACTVRQLCASYYRVSCRNWLMTEH
jgi:hypothetical protein